MHPRTDLLAWLVVTCTSIVLVAAWIRGRIARSGHGRLAQVRWRTQHGREVIGLLGGRFDPRRGSPWIDTYLGERPVQLLAAPLDGRLQAAVLLLDHRLPLNAWDVAAVTGDAAGGERDGAGDDELELAAGVDEAAARRLVAELATLEVDSVTCGAPVESDPRPPHIVRMRFDEVAQLPERLERLEAVLRELEALEAA